MPDATRPMPHEERVLALFLSNGGSLTRWRTEAILSREMLLYLQYLRAGVFDRILVFSYDPADHLLVRELAPEEPLYDRIQPLTPPRRLSGIAAIVWGWRGVRLHRRTLARAAWIKTNQVSGAWAAVYARRLTGAKLLFRMGYLLSRRFRLNGSAGKAALARRVEDVGLAAATHVVVTAADTARELEERPVARGKVMLAPTYVDVGLFSPAHTPDFAAPALWVGRFEPQKNVLNMVRACQRLDLALDVAGRGSLEGEMRAIAEEQDRAPLSFRGLVPNEALPALMRSHSLFLLPSLHEGLPKVLIEAMACGMTCVASNIPGVTDLIEDGVSGYLIDGFDADAIARAIRRALDAADPAIGRNARATVQDRFSLQRYAAREAELFLA